MVYLHDSGVWCKSWHFFFPIRGRSASTRGKGSDWSSFLFVPFYHIYRYMEVSWNGGSPKFLNHSYKDLYIYIDLWKIPKFLNHSWKIPKYSYYRWIFHEVNHPASSLRVAPNSYGNRPVHPLGPQGQLRQHSSLVKDVVQRNVGPIAYQQMGKYMTDQYIHIQSHTYIYIYMW